MPRYSVGDEVVIKDSTGNDGQWSYYLSGSTGLIERIMSGGYKLEFIDIADAHPETRSSKGYKLEFLLKNAVIGEKDLIPADHPLIAPQDDGFELVFE